jgi:hypothetical protein
LGFFGGGGQLEILNGKKNSPLLCRQKEHAKKFQKHEITEG